MASKKSTKKKTLEQHVEQPVHNLVGYGILFAFCLIALFIVLNNPL